ncbi:hypothetical protein OEA41_007425 [Lepraria neglecta]|uniref:Aquaporin-like protein n=1 Tax=Lepraria neglecta TaxID=209136 RepID=A0AAD9ZCR2_9LECA|nr:hypothetical protein OEA41_007425 [Lepraria neglecta]
MNIDAVAGDLLFPGVGNRHGHGTDTTIINHLPILRFLPRGFRAHFVAMCGKPVSTFLLLFFAFSGTQVANTQTQAARSKTTLSQAADPAQLLYISLCFGFSLAVNAWVFFRISGGLFNPAVTLGLCLVGGQSWIRGVLITISQLLGAIASAGFVSALFPGPLNVKTALSAGTSVSQRLFIEMFLTAQLVFTIVMLAAEKHKATFIAPIGFGLSLFIAKLTDLLAWPYPRVTPRIRLLQIHQDARVRDCKPWPGFQQVGADNFDPNAHKFAPVVNFNQDETLEQEKHGDPETMTNRTEATDYYAPDGLTPSPDSRTAGMGARSAIKGKMKGLRAEAGHSLARNTSGTTAVDSSNTYAGNTDQSYLIQSFEDRKATNGSS